MYAQGAVSAEELAGPDMAHVCGGFSSGNLKAGLNPATPAEDGVLCLCFFTTGLPLPALKTGVSRVCVHTRIQGDGEVG